MKSVIKTLLREGLFQKDTKANTKLLEDFIAFAKNYLKITDGEVELCTDRSKLETTAAYANKKVLVYVIDRALVDIMRSIAHELVHLKQDVEGRLKPEDHEKNNAAGSPIENEANSIAGVLIRIYGKKHPEIYI